MRFNVTAFALTAGLIWAALILTVGLANLVWPGYGRAFLDVISSIYPGYHPGSGSGAGSVITATLYGLVDAAIAGAVFGWLYNLLAQGRSGKAA
jgi:hypothetical protein